MFLAASLPDRRPLSTDDNPEQSTKMTRARRSGSTLNTSLSPPSSQIVDPNERNLSEAQRRGIYDHCSSLPSDRAYLNNGYVLKRPPDDEACDRSTKRRCGPQEREDGEPNEPSEACNTHEGNSLPKTPLSVFIPSTERSGNRQTSHDPGRSASQATHSQKSAPIEEDVSRAPYNEAVKRLRGTLSPSKSLGMAPMPRSTLSAEHRMLGVPTSKTSPHKPLGVGPTPSQGPVQQQEDQTHPPFQREPASSGRVEDITQTPDRANDHYSPTLTQNEDSPSQAPTGTSVQILSPSATTENPAENDSATIGALLKAFDEEERVKQEEHKEDLVRREHEQKLELEHELYRHSNQKRQDNETARRADRQRQNDVHEKNLAEVRRHFK